MSTPHPIALIGFSELEHSTFESLFCLAARRPPGYQIVADVSAATLILANADDVAVMAALRDHPPLAKVLLIGRSDGGTGWPRQPRPIKLMSVLTAMDQLLLPRAQAVTPSTPGVDPLARWAPDATLPAPVHTRRLTQAVAPARVAPSDESVLVVDDSDTALKFMERLLRRVGYQADLVHSGEEALQKLLRQSYRIVFVDVVMTGMDGYQVCRAIKNAPFPDGRTPVVVMLTSQGGAIDKLKGRMAGCDAYLIKPLSEDDLLRVLARHGA
jgi:CheY-like chemotaxis protein